jgi:ribonuclease VapC
MRRRRAAYGRDGKGFDPNARLNLGDCASYALAKGLNAPLLFKGTDFPATDVIVAA